MITNFPSLNTLILLGVISIAGIMVIQGVWVRKTMELQVKNIAIQEKEDSLNLKEFSEQSHVALRNVLEKINTNFSDSSDLYGAVKQIRTNRFKVDINEELQPYYLETLLKKAFYEQSGMKIVEAYKYASEVMIKNMMEAESEEGILAFIEKRKPNWD